MAAEEYSVVGLCPPSPSPETAQLEILEEGLRLAWVE